MLGRGNRDLKRLAAVESGLEEKLANGLSDLCSPEQLNQLAVPQAKTPRMVQFMTCRVSRRILEDYRLRLFARKEIPVLIDEIRTHGHEMSA